MFLEVFLFSLSHKLALDTLSNFIQRGQDGGSPLMGPNEMEPIAGRNGVAPLLCRGDPGLGGKIRPQLSGQSRFAGKRQVPSDQERVSEFGGLFRGDVLGAKAREQGLGFGFKILAM